MKRWQFVALGFIAYGAMMIAGAPAVLLDAMIARASEGRLRIAEPRGTVWSGAGQLQLLDRSRQAGIGKSIAWRLSPSSVWRRRIVVEVDAGVRRFAVALSPSRIEIANADFDLPAGVLGIALPKLAPLALGGDLAVHITDLAVTGNGTHANAIVRWRGARSAHARVSPLGEYELRLEHAGSTSSARLLTLGGPLQLDGSGSWSAGSRPAFASTARVAPEYREQLGPLIRLIAVDRGAGNHELQLQ